MKTQKVRRFATVLYHIVQRLYLPEMLLFSFVNRRKPKCSRLSVSLALLTAIINGASFSLVHAQTNDSIQKVEGVTAKATSELTGLGRYASDAVNGVYCDWYFWESSGVGVRRDWAPADDPAPAITFDMGAVVPLAYLVLWNSHENIDVWPSAIKRMEILVSTNNITFNSLGEWAVNPGAPDHTNCPPVPQTNFLSAVSTRYVKFRILENYANQTFPIVGNPPAGNTFAAIDEVEFYAYGCDPVKFRPFKQGDGSTNGDVPIYFGDPSQEDTGSKSTNRDSDPITGRAKTVNGGCALCSLAAMLTSIPELSYMTPAILDRDLTSLTSMKGCQGGYKGRAFVEWNAVGPAINYPISLILSSGQTDTTIGDYLSEHVCNDFDRVILQLKEIRSNGTTGTHYVFVTGRTNGNDWAVFDPGWKKVGPQENLSTLSGHQIGFTTTNRSGNILHRQFHVMGVRTYTLNYNDAPITSFGGSLACPAEVLVIDPQGRRLGYDPDTGNDLFEIPGSSYFREFPLAVDGTDVDYVEGDPTGTKTFSIPNPLPGTYKVLLAGTGTGAYTLDLETSGSGIVHNSSAYSGTAVSGVSFTNDFVVHTLPEISDEPTNLSVAVGDDAAFMVAATGSPPLTYQWRKSGTNLIGAGNISGAMSTNLTITNVQLADAGDYDVVVSNDYGARTSQVATLTVEVNGTGQTNLASALLAYFPFDGNAQDASGNGRDGVVYGALLTTNRFGVANSAYAFNGTNFIEVDGLDPDDYTNGFSFGAWLEPTAYSGALGWTYDAGWGSTFIAAGGTTVHFRVGTGNDVTDHYLTANVPLNQWSHLFITHSPTNDAFYLDGELAGQWPSYPMQGNVPTLLIGSSYAGNFNGAIDEVAVFSRELSSNEVSIVYSGGLAAILGSPAYLETPTINGADFSFNLIAQPGTQFAIQVSTNLTDWATVRTVTIPPAGTTNLLEGTTPGATQEFYRVLKQ